MLLASGIRQSLSDVADGRETLNAWLHPADRDSVLRRLADSCEEGTPIDIQFRLRTASGEYRWFRAWGARSSAAHDRLACVAGVMRDITGHRLDAASQAESEHTELKRQRMQAIDCLASGVAHEFNNLLQAICGYVEFARQSAAEDSATYQDLSRALEAADIASTITRRLLEFARAEEQPEHAIDLRQSVASFTDLIRPITGQGVRVAFELADEPLITTGDETAFKQVLLNLVINSRDAMPDGGDIVIQMTPFTLAPNTSATLSQLRPGRYARIVVNDTGAGIPAELRDVVLQPFFSTKPHGAGTGLGLSVCHGVTRRWGGLMIAESREGDGTAISLYLPLVEDNATRVELPAHVGGRFTLAPQSPASEAALRALVDQVGGVVVDVLDEHAGEAFPAAPCDFLVIEEALTGDSRAQMARAIADSFPYVSVLFCTSLLAQSRRAFAGLPNVTVLTSPVDATQLAQAAQRSPGGVPS